MGKNIRITVRSHDQERNWFSNLGNGNLVDGIKDYIRQERGDQLWGEAYVREKREKSQR